MKLPSDTDTSAGDVAETRSPGPTLSGEARIKAATLALCSALAAHRPVQVVPPTEQDIASLADSLLDEMPEDHQTAEVAASLQHVSQHLLFGMANLSHRALDRAYAELKTTPSTINDPEAGQLMRTGMIIGAHLINREPRTSPLQRELLTLTASAFSDVLHGSAPAIDADALERLSLSDDAQDQVRLAAQTAFQSALKKLAECDACPAPVFQSWRSRDPGQGWKPSRTARRYETRSDVFEALTHLRPDDLTPLPRLAVLHPDARQTLDRETGLVSVRFPATSKTDATVTTLNLPVIGDRHDPLQRASQDSALDLLDRFCATPFADKTVLWSLRPPALTLDTPGQMIRVGELPVAKLTPEAWSLDAKAAEHVSEVLERPARRIERPVHEWSGPRAPLASATTPGGRRAVRLILQAEDDRTILDNAASRQVAHPHESVWIQVDRQGRQRILAGQRLLDRLPADARIKVEVHGHGGRIGLTDERGLSGLSAGDVTGLLNDVMEALRLRQPIDAVDLVSCALATPVFPRRFAEELLKAGHDLGLFRAETEITAYADPLSFILFPRTAKKAAHRQTVFSESSPFVTHAPGKTFAYSLERGTGKLIIRDKHPGVDAGHRPPSRGEAPQPADAGMPTSVAPWRFPGPLSI